MVSIADDSVAQPRSRGSTVDRVIAHLRDGILNSRFAPGQRLIEADLTEELSVSRGPLREAFRKLSAEGLIEIVPNRGAVVRRLSFTEMNELFQIRTELECLAAGLAAARLTDEPSRVAFEGAIEAIWSDEPRLSAAAYLEENRRFHDAIVVASGNTQLAVISRQLQLPLILAQLSGALTEEVLRSSVCEHREIANAILSGDGAAAAAAMRGHLVRAVELARTMPGSTFRRNSEGRGAVAKTSSAG